MTMRVDDLKVTLILDEAPQYMSCIAPAELQQTHSSISQLGAWAYFGLICNGR